jgi:hypothetical protein
VFLGEQGAVDQTDAGATLALGFARREQAVPQLAGNTWTLVTHSEAHLILEDIQGHVNGTALGRERQSVQQEIDEHPRYRVGRFDLDVGAAHEAKLDVANLRFVTDRQYGVLGNGEGCANAFVIVHLRPDGATRHHVCSTRVLVSNGDGVLQHACSCVTYTRATYTVRIGARELARICKPAEHDGECVGDFVQRSRESPIWNDTIATRSETCTLGGLHERDDSAISGAEGIFSCGYRW